MEIPRLTCSLFGAIKAAATIKDTVILVHGPKGCVYHVNYILGLRGDCHCPVYCTCMDEHDVVFGAEERLKEAIEDLDSHKGAEMIVVLSCCASGIIGEDVQNACRIARTRAKVIGIEAGGFSSEFTAGYAQTLVAIISEVADPAASIEPRTVNLIGMLRAGPDLQEIRRLLLLLGLTVRVVMPAGATLDQIRRIGAASLNIVICETAGMQAALLLQQRFGTPFIRTVYPVGAGLSREFLQDVASALGISTAPDIPEPAAGETQIPHMARIALFSGPTRAIALARFLSSHGISPSVIVLDFGNTFADEVKKAAGDGCTVLISPRWDEIEDAMRAHRIDLVLGGLMERPIAAKLGIPLIDVMHGSLLTAGPEGGSCVLRMIGENIRSRI
ncbi:MAG: light-independent protochlorophyllide reductase subunit B [Methanoregulaceae archaeon PtaB.Bin056]|nr:MAG: light-independent protochlorophyllide reductase subunit B [Methanoregulaceae archaeon PtaB.Bin056]